MRIAVIGNGVIGLTTAIELIIKGRDVVIYTKDPDHKSSEDTVSIVACALWQPYKLFTNLDEFGVEEFDLVKKVTLRSLNEFYNISNTDGPEKSGVYVKMHYEYSIESIYSESTVKFKRDYFYIEILKDFWKSKGDNYAIIDEIKLKNKPPFKAVDKDNYEREFEYLHGYKTFIIDPSIFLNYLTIKFKNLGGKIIKKTINLNELKKLPEKIIFNCSGINGVSIINKSSNIDTNSSRKILPKKGVLLLYNLKNDKCFDNTIVLDELAILCRKNHLTIGTGVLKDDENPEILVNRLKIHAKQFAESNNIDKFGFDLFLKYHSIDLDKPNNQLLGARPYFTDGKGYLMDRFDYISKSNKLFTLYNNFGHGGSGVTLSLGCASEITDLYLTNSLNKLHSINHKRFARAVSDFSLEIAHFEIKKLHYLSEYEIEELVKREIKYINEAFQKLSLINRSVSICTLIDDKEAQSDKATIRKLVNVLSKLDIDYIAFESRLNTYISKLNGIIPNKMTKEFNNYMINHFKLGCAQDIFIWYCLRLGIVDFSFEDGVIQPISSRAKNDMIPFVANSLISILDKSLKTYEEKADEYMRKSFGFEIATAIIRYYY